MGVLSCIVLPKNTSCSTAGYKSGSDTNSELFERLISKNKLTKKIFDEIIIIRLLIKKLNYKIQLE